MARVVGFRMAGSIGGSTPVHGQDRVGTVALFDRFNLVLALENHPHLPTSESMLDAIADSAGGHIGTAVDTGRSAESGRRVEITSEFPLPPPMERAQYDVAPE